MARLNPRALALAVLSALALFHAREAVFEGRAFYVRDLHLQWYGQIESFVRVLHAGSWPLWDPWVSFGQPMLANPNTQVLYPPTWLNLLMRPWTYYTLYLVGHMVLAGFGMWRLSQRLGASSSGALLAAALFVSSGPFLSLGNLWNHLAGAAWLPWTLLATQAALQAPSLRLAAGLGATLALAVLAGSPDFAVLNGLAAGAFFLGRLIGPWDVEARRRLLTGLAALVFALGLAAAQILPSAELAGRAERFSQSPEEQAYWSLHPMSLAQAIVPVGWADLPFSPAWSQALHEGREPYLFSLFVGLPALALALSSIGHRPRREPLILWTILVAGVLFALGRHTPLHGLVLALLPPLAVVRFPAKAAVLAVCALCLLAALGIEALGRARGAGEPPQRLALVLTSILSLASLGAAASVWLAPAWVQGALLAPGSTAPGALRPLLTALALAAVSGAATVVLVTRANGVAALGLMLLAVLPPAWRHRSLNPTAPLELFTTRPAVLDALRLSPDQRVFVYDYLATPGRARARLGREAPYVVPSSGPWLAALGQRLYLLPPAGAAFGVRDSFGRDLLGIQPTPLARLNARALLSDETPAFARLLRAGAVGQVVALHDLGPDFRLERTLHGPFLEDLRVFAVPDPLPRALVVGGARVNRQPLLTLEDPAFDPRLEVVLAEGPERRPEPGFVGSVRTLEERPDRLRLATRASSEGWLLLMDSHDPGWLATLDGSKATLRAANVAFRGVPVPAGDHEVKLVYRPPAVLRGLLASAVFGLLALGAARRTRRS